MHASINITVIFALQMDYLKVHVIHKVTAKRYVNKRLSHMRLLLCCLFSQDFPSQEIAIL